LSSRFLNDAIAQFFSKMGYFSLDLWTPLIWYGSRTHCSTTAFAIGEPARLEIGLGGATSHSRISIRTNPVGLKTHRFFIFAAIYGWPGLK
jgi:hypothetical protein